MNKSDFLTYLVNLYGTFLDDKKQELWIRDCADVLDDDIDYTQFRFHFLHEFDTRTINNIPSPQWLYKESRKFVRDDRTAIEQTQAYINEQSKIKGVPCPEHIRQQMKAYFKGFNEKAI